MSSDGNGDGNDRDAVDLSIDRQMAEADGSETTSTGFAGDGSEGGKADPGQVYGPPAPYSIDPTRMTGRGFAPERTPIESVIRADDKDVLSALSIAMGVSGAKKAARPTGYNPNAAYGGSMFAEDPLGPASLRSPRGGVSDYEGGDQYTQEGLLRLSSAAPAQAAPFQPLLSTPVPEYEFLENWWEGNRFFPAPITRKF